jgi:hypothetical protein
MLATNKLVAINRTKAMVDEGNSGITIGIRV